MSTHATEIIKHKAISASGRLKSAFGSSRKKTKWVLWSAEYNEKDAKKVLGESKHGMIIKGLGSDDPKDIRYGVYMNWWKK